MTFQIGLHLASVIPAILLGIIILANKKGTQTHKLIGRSWVVLMLIASISSFFIKKDGAFSWIHILSIVTISSLAFALFAIRNGNVKMHRSFMIGAFAGAITAGLFAVIIPGRIGHTFLFGGG